MPNKDLSNWLVVSDIDGTLNNKLRLLPKRNLEAINSFVLEYNGHFTLASGRNVQSLRKHFERLPISGTPAVVLNGAGIYDYSKEKMVHFSSINSHAQSVVEDIYNKFPSAEIEVHTDEMIYTLNSRIFCPVMVAADKLDHKNCRRFSEIPEENWGKVIFFGMPNVINNIKKYVASLTDTRANFMSSSIVTLEMLEENTHKGTAVQKIAEMYGIDYKHTSAIGDYFNDYDMLKSVYLSACCGQAPKELKAITKYHACHCNKGAVGDLLEYIIKNNGNFKED